LAVAVAAFGVAALVLLIQLLISRPHRLSEH